MQLTPAQAVVARKWIEDGAKLSEFQRKLESEFGIKLTYMETRFVVDDLKVVPKDPEPPKAPEPAPAEAAATPGAAPADPVVPDALPGGGGSVSVVVDTITRPGAIASGSVKFSDGQTAQWYLDQTGRFGMVPPYKGYRPSEPDLQQFQLTLDRELQKLGI
jgi:hypothetical protein